MQPSIPLTPEQSAIIERQLTARHFATPSQVLDGALRLMDAMDEAYLARLSDLREAMREGRESGSSTPWNVEDFLNSMHQTHAARGHD